MTALPTLAGLDAVLLDMDGTLVNSYAAVERAWITWAEANGLDGAAVIADCHGNSAETTIRRWLPNLSDAEVHRHMDEHVELECRDVADVVATPGALDLVQLLDQRDVRWAVATTAPQRLALARLHAGGIFPPILVGLDDVAEGKPAPDVYLEAARRCGADPARCLAAEDSAPGRESARRAGAQVFDVGPGGHSLIELVDAWR